MFNTYCPNVNHDLHLMAWILSRVWIKGQYMLQTGKNFTENFQDFIGTNKIIKSTKGALYALYLQKIWVIYIFIFTFHIRIHTILL